jgi:6-phosphogluconolactonase
MGRAGLASMLSLAMALGVTACSNDYTVSYVYMATSKTLPHGLINAYQVDYQSGYLLPMTDSPIDAGGRDTVALVIAPNQLFLYTVNNFDSNVVEFAIGTDGKLYPQNTYNITGSLPTAAAIDAAGKFLYVTFTYQNTRQRHGTVYAGQSRPRRNHRFPRSSRTIPWERRWRRSTWAGVPWASTPAPRAAMST